MYEFSVLTLPLSPLFSQPQRYFEENGVVGANGRSPIELLRIQYRMHPSISLFPSKYFYDGQLEDGSNVKKPSFGDGVILPPYVQPAVL